MASHGASQEARKDPRERETARREGNDGLQLTEPRFGSRRGLLSTGYACGKGSFPLSKLYERTISVYAYAHGGGCRWKDTANLWLADRWPQRVGNQSLDFKSDSRGLLNYCPSQLRSPRRTPCVFWANRCGELRVCERRIFINELAHRLIFWKRLFGSLCVFSLRFACTLFRI